MRTLTLAPDRMSTRAADDGSLELDGLAVPWEYPIEYGGITERFARGAISPDDAVGRPLLWAHDRAEPIGHITAAADREDGLAITAVVQPTTRGRDAITLLRSGSLRGLSIGFTPVDQRNTPTGVVYTRADLAELSVTPLPAYRPAEVTATRDEETPVAEATETREAMDLAPINERIDQLEKRIARRAEPQRTLGVVEAFVTQLRDSGDRRQLRALADVVSSGNAGVLPPAWSSEVVGYVDSMRYLVPKLGSMGFPASGHTLTVPKITQHTTVGPRGAEKSQIPSQALTTGSSTYTAQWYAGGVDVSLEVIWQSDPSVWALVVEDLMAQYAIVTDQAVTTAAEAAATAGGAALDTSSYGALVAGLIETAEEIRAATGMPGDSVAATTATFQAILGLVDADGRRILATSGASNADGSAGLTSQSVSIGGINVFHNPRAAVDLQFNTKSLRVAEKAPVTLTSDNVALMGRDVGVVGALIVLPIYAAGIVKYA